MGRAVEITAGPSDRDGWPSRPSNCDGLAWGAVGWVVGRRWTHAARCRLAASFKLTVAAYRGRCRCQEGGFAAYSEKRVIGLGRHHHWRRGCPSLSSRICPRLDRPLAITPR
ncbi:hypothetical protein ACLOJK_039247 [Asimina triloba]